MHCRPASRAILAISKILDLATLDVSFAASTLNELINVSLARPVTTLP